MKVLVALFALVVLAANVAAFTDLELVQRSLCMGDYQCKDNCVCESPRRNMPKMCFCYSPYHRGQGMFCRRSEYL